MKKTTSHVWYWVMDHDMTSSYESYHMQSQKNQNELKKENKRKEKPK